MIFISTATTALAAAVESVLEKPRYENDYEKMGIREKEIEHPLIILSTFYSPI
jgi:hypothetical protein